MIPELVLIIGLGLCFLVPAFGYTGLILWRWITWTRVEAKVFGVNPKKGEIKLTYVVGGRPRTAVKGGGLGRATVGDPAVVRYDPERPFRYQVARPVWRTLGMMCAAVLAAGGVAIIVAGITGPRANDDLDLPWFVAIGVGLVVLSIGSWMASYQWKRRTWLEADGTITAAREMRSTNSTDNTTTVTYQVTYEFVDDVKEQTRITTTDTWFRSHERTQPVRVRYDPVDPDRSDISTPRQRLLWWASAVALLVLGAGLVVLGYVDVIGQDATY